MVRDPQERQISEIFNDMSNNESIPLNTTESWGKNVAWISKPFNCCINNTLHHISFSYFLLILCGMSINSVLKFLRLLATFSTTTSLYNYCTSVNHLNRLWNHYCILQYSSREQTEGCSGGGRSSCKMMKTWQRFIFLNLFKRNYKETKPIFSNIFGSINVSNLFNQGCNSALRWNTVASALQRRWRGGWMSKWDQTGTQVVARWVV